jgi:hypothetical protein
MNAVDELVTKDMIDVYGTTTINHKIRVRLGLTMAEYVVMDFLDYALTKRKPITYEYSQRRTGLAREQFIQILASLRDKGFTQSVAEEGKLPTIIPTRLWLDAFMIPKEWFESFWMVGENAYWPGSRKKAQQLFEKLCKTYSPEYLLKCKENYVTFMAHPANDWRKVMGAPVFLNPETERFKEDWSGQLKKIKAGDTHPAEPRAPRITKTDKDKLFS